MPETDNYTLLLRKLDEFIRKYYRNQLIRGAIYFIAVFILFYLLVTITEYFARFGTITRTILFYAYFLINALILWNLVIIPLFKLFRFGKIISHEEAARIIGYHFPEVSDKLLNTLQLKKIVADEEQIAGLVNASINQKIDKLRPVPFKSAIDLKKNLHYLRYAIPPLVILILLFIAAPNVITEPTTRIINYDEAFAKPAPFTITVLNNKLEAFQQDDYKLEVKVEGETLPAEVFIDMNDYTYKLERKSPIRFEYTFRNLQESKKFSLVAAQVRTAVYELKVLPKPIVLNFEASMKYPAYTGKKNEVLDNTGDLVIPAGTSVTWKFFTRDTKQLIFRLGNITNELDNNSSNAFSFNKRFLKSSLYSVIPVNEYMQSRDSLVYSVSVIPDAYPFIQVDQVQDSVLDKRQYFRGIIKDDYGFKRLTFNYTIIPDGKADSIKATEKVMELPISLTATQQQFFHALDMDSLELQPGDQVIYHFEIWDNDAVNGSKRSKSQEMVFKAPTMDEIEKKTDQDNEKIKDDMENSIREAKELQKKADELSRKLVEKETIDWQDKQQIQQLLDQQKQFQDKIEKIQKENRDKALQEQQYKKVDEELIRKQKQLEDLFEQVMTPEMKKMFEELQKLLDQADKDKINQLLQKMKDNNEDVEKQLDRNLELFKQLAFEKQLQETIDKLNELAKKQEELSDKSDEKKADSEKLKEEQDKLNKEFEDLRKQMDDLAAKNKDLEEPNKMENTDPQEEEIKQNMDQSSDDLDNGKPGKASKSQKSASDKMKKLSEQLSQMQSDMYSEDLGENIETLREILENLLQISFDQENLIKSTVSTSTLDPQYIKLIQEQKQIKDDLVMVEDSLWALSKRQASIEPYVTRNIDDINSHVGKSIDNLNDRMKNEAGSNQQYVMTSVNNLALLLSEALQQMEQAMQMQSSGQCKKGNPKPGKGSASMKSISQMQKQLGEQIKKMKESMGKGQKGSNPDKNGATSEQFVKLAAQQEAIRQMMQSYEDQMKEQGMGNDGDLKDLKDQMDKNETELVNKLITQQMMERLKDIEVRLLKHEKAELQRGQEEKRESSEPKNLILSNPEGFSEYNKLKSKEVELLRTVPPNLRPFYKSKVNEYFYNFEMK